MAKKDFSILASENFKVPAVSQDAMIDAVVRDSTREHAEIAFSVLLPNPKQPRKSFDDAKIQELADSIAEQGLLEEIVVRRSPTQEGQFEIICGERRTRACRDKLGWTHIFATIRVCTDSELLEIAVIENEQRQDVPPYEIALAYRDLYESVDEHGEKLFSIRTLAKRLGKDKSRVQEYLDMLKAPPKVVQLIQDDPTTSVRIITELADVTDERDQDRLVQGVRERRWKTDDIIAIVRELKKQQRMTKDTPNTHKVSPQAPQSAQHQEKPEGVHNEEVPAPQQGVQSESLPSAALLLAERKRGLTKDARQIERIVSQYRIELPLMQEDEKRLLHDHIRHWIEALASLV